MIVVVNKSTRVTAADALTMTRACATQAVLHAAPAWKRAALPVVFMPDEKYAPPGSWVIAILDNPDQADALGWHTEDQGEVIYGRVFAGPVLDHQGSVLYGDLTVASVLSHEVLETLVDPNVNLWAQAGGGDLVALEVGDPVESDSYPITVKGQIVSVSNFVLPAWFDVDAKPGDQFDWMRRCTKPFTMTSGGYVVKMNAGQVSQVFGEQYPEWRKAMKAIDVARTARRVAETT